MSCFGGESTWSSGMTRGSSSRTSRGPWRWWRAKCAGIAASVGSKLRRTIKGLDGRRRRRRRWRRATSSSSSVMTHHCRRCSNNYSSGFAPVYVDELYTRHDDAHQQPCSSSSKPLNKLNAAAVAVQEKPISTSGSKLLLAADAGGNKATARVVVAATTTTATAGGARAAGAGKPPRAAADAAGVAGAMRSKSILQVARSPGRSGGGGALGVVKGMGEVDLRAELFIRRFKEDMRLQSQRSAEEFQAMLARGL